MIANCLAKQAAKPRAKGVTPRAASSLEQENQDEDYTSMLGAGDRDCGGMKQDCGPLAMAGCSCEGDDRRPDQDLIVCLVCEAYLWTRSPSGPWTAAFGLRAARRIRR